MPILSISVINQVGNVLVSIQNTPTKNMNAMLSQFGRLNKKDNVTYIISEKVRYLYRLIEGVYIVITSTLNSNIVDDSDLLQSVVAVLSQELDGISEEKICQDVFLVSDIISEFCNYDGTCEHLSTSEVDVNLLMESYEEEQYILELKQKKKDAKKLAEQRAEELQAERKLREKMEKLKGDEEKILEEKWKEIERMKQEQLLRNKEENETKEKVRRQNTAPKKKSGIVLGKTKPLFENLEDVESENENSVELDDGVEEKQVKVEKKQKSATLMTENMIVKLQETLSCSLYSERSECSFSLTGSLSVCVADVAKSHIPLKIHPATYPVKVQLHPQMDSSQFNKNNVLIPKQNSKGYAVGAHPSLCAKWSYSTSDVSELPVAITCWPSEEEESVSMTMSYEMKTGFDNMKMIIPINDSIEVNNCDGTYEISQDGLEWNVEDSTEGGTGSMDFIVNSNNVGMDDMFPVKVIFAVKQSMSGIGIESVELENVTTDVQFDTDFKVYQ
ncbi:Coatomer subunit delta [Entamoeba marina]